VTALLLSLGVNTLPLLAVTFVLGGAYVGMEETLEDSLAASVLAPGERGVGFGTLAVVNGLGDFCKQSERRLAMGSLRPDSRFCFCSGADESGGAPSASRHWKRTCLGLLAVC